jgi:hypothetical protein
MYLERTERLQTALELGFEQPAHASREIWDQSGGEFGIQKQFKIIKNYSTKPNWSSTAGWQEGELIQRWVMNEAQYKGK